MSSFLITASSSSGTSRVVKSMNVMGTLSSPLPMGRAALQALGGKEKEVDSSKSAMALLEERIVIPVGITPATLHKFTLYDILGMGTWADCADMEIIKKAYHKAVLAYHPDKQPFKMADGKDDRSVFLKIQEAYSTLTSQDKRRAYDSQLPFDDSIPSAERIEKALIKGPERYLGVYDKVFKRNARFAVKKPVPEIGTMATPLNEVMKFYDYWVKFESWRDFTGIGAEHKPDDAGSRYEKRYMQKENEKLAKKLKMKEMERLVELVTNCMNQDPRIVADKLAKKEAKEKAANDKEASARIKREADEAAKAWMEQEEAEYKEQAKLNKAEKEKLKKAQSKARNVMKKLFRAFAEKSPVAGCEYGAVTEGDVELLCAHCSLQDLNQINNSLGGEAATKDTALCVVATPCEDGPLGTVVRDMLVFASECKNQVAEDERVLREAKKRDAENAANPQFKKQQQQLSRGHASSGNMEALERVWDREALSMLSKCVRRYPAGSPNRWVSITNYMNDQLKPTHPKDASVMWLFEVDECLRAAHNAVKNMTSSSAAK